MQNYFGMDYISIRYDKANHVVVLEWIIPPTSDEFREGLNSLLAAMEHFKTGKIITDVGHLGTIHPDNQRWAATEWLQSALKIGYSHIAIIMPSDIFTQMSVEDTMSQVDSPLPSAYFDNMEKAIEWIK